jgi:hypothetical protein
MSSIDKFDTEETEIEDNSNIVYITLGIIVCLIVIWLFIVFLTGENPIKILNEMTSSTTQVTPVNDT